jgi:hypothetical protein
MLHKNNENHNTITIDKRLNVRKSVELRIILGPASRGGHLRACHKSGGGST